MLGCQGARILDPSGSEGTSTTSGTSSATSGITTVTVTTASTTDSTEDTTTDPSSGDFILRPDTNHEPCDLWAQDCPAGEKCNPSNVGGGSSWNTSKCVPVDPNPKGEGEACTVEGHETSGLDDCDFGLMCFAGECVPLCKGGENDPMCDDPCDFCNLTGDGVLIICLSHCDPIVQDCGSGKGCYPVNDKFACAPDVSEDQGNYGSECEFINACNPGLFCIPGDLLPSCPGQSCCSPACNLQSPSCPDPNLGVECLPWYEEPPPPDQCVGSEVGICAVPPP